MTKAKDIIKLLEEISPRRRDQLKTELKSLEAEVKKVQGVDKQVLADAIRGIVLSLGGKPVSDSLRRTIFKAIEIVRKRRDK